MITAALMSLFFASLDIFAQKKRLTWTNNILVKSCNDVLWLAWAPICGQPILYRLIISLS